MKNSIEAFSVSVNNTTDSFIIERSWGGVFISPHGRLVSDENAVLLESRKLAEQYKDAITARRLQSGDKNFEATIVSITHLSARPNFLEKIKKDSENIIKKLEKWNYPTPQNITINDSGWIIGIKQDEHRLMYLVTLNKNGVRLHTEKEKAKIYKRETFVQKAITEINKNPKLNAIAMQV